ncbi:hypothetical protein [Streptomyces sp. NPDC058045]|uniref:hypothetical protein n=1 Tax=Streptomyces sp. NPDC058045 TaxID=3346311 RepID=UPI0036E4194D
MQGEHWTAEDSEAAVKELRGALDRAAVTIPSLGVDFGAFTYDQPLVELGRIRPDIALRLAEVISRGAKQP